MQKDSTTKHHQANAVRKILWKIARLSNQFYIYQSRAIHFIYAIVNIKFFTGELEIKH